MTKDASVWQLLSKLAQELNSRDFQVIDHWDADLHAIGIARADEAQRLVYVSTTQFGEVVDRAAKLLCAAAAGRIKALADAEKQAKAREELQRWQSAFPDDPELKDAEHWVALTDRPRQ